jgi:hypothetical protein
MFSTIMPSSASLGIFDSNHMSKTASIIGASIIFSFVTFVTLAYKYA